MAKQIGPVHLSGQIGGIVFFVGPDGAGAKGEGSLTRERVMTEANFERSRRAGSAFGLAAKGGSVLRSAIGKELNGMAETRMTGRLNKRMYQIIKSDTSSEFLDEKRIQNGDLSLLKGFSWHQDKPLNSGIAVEYAASIDRATGVMEVSFPSFVPKRGLKPSDGATHFELFAIGASLDFEKKRSKRQQVGSGVLRITGGSTGDIVLRCSIAGGSDLPLVLGLGILFYQQVGGKMMLLADGGCFEIVEVAV